MHQTHKPTLSNQKTYPLYLPTTNSLYITNYWPTTSNQPLDPPQTTNKWTHLIHPPTPWQHTRGELAEIGAPYNLSYLYLIIVQSKHSWKPEIRTVSTTPHPFTKILHPYTTQHFHTNHIYAWTQSKYNKLRLKTPTTHLTRRHTSNTQHHSH